MKKKQKKSKSKLPFLIFGAVTVIFVSAILTMGGLESLYRSQAPALPDGDPTLQKQFVTGNYTSERIKRATSYNDFADVCAGYTIINASKFNTRSSAVIATFTQSSRVPSTWLFDPVGYGRPYVTGNEYHKINTVACLMEIRDTRVFSKMCDYIEDGTTVSIKYYSVKYKLSYFEATTGKRIADAGNIETPADTCPTYAVYDQQTLSVAAVPDSHAIQAAHDLFVTQP